jgi:regulator of protease activity HflC (stomatin/prohibitin superfamily)
MKRIKVEAYKVAIVLKDGKFVKLLGEGTYWFWNEEVIVYNMTAPFVPPINMNILLQYPAITNALHVVDVKENEIVLQYENGFYKNMLTTGRYAYWKGLINYEFVRINLDNYEIDSNVDKAVLLKTALSGSVRAFVVESYEQGLMFVDGKFNRKLGAGTYYFWKNATTIEIKKADTRLMQMEISGQEILTKDKANIRVNFYTQYKVTDIEKALLENKEYDKQMYTMIQLALREYIGGFTLDEMLEKKENISAYIIESLMEKTNGLGVEITNAGIRDLILPGDMKDIMNQVLIAEKKAQANTIMRREETASTRSLLNTAKLMEENEMLMRLKEMEYVEKIADKINNISVGGGGAILEQMRQLFVPAKK